MAVGSTSELSAQLVVEILVHDLAPSLAFYEAFGFELERRTETFAVLRWNGSYLFLAEERERPASSSTALANVRVIVQDVDAVWELAQVVGARVERALADRAYGLRDFTVLDPDGFGVRFAQVLPGIAPGSAVHV
jgi:catechol 2,3-dioxygenase-like lactoylglutathione lyase family enzyme